MTIKRLIRVFAAVACATLLLLSSRPVRTAHLAQTLAIMHVTIVDVEHLRLETDRTVLIEGERIVAIGGASETTVPAGSRVIDATGKFLIPGLWDMHVHALRNLNPGPIFDAFVANGVLGIRDMGSPPDSFDLIKHWRERVQRGDYPAPRFVASGPLVDGPVPMFPHLSIGVGSDTEARRAVRSVAARGADFVKVYSLLPREAYFAIADESRKLGIAFAGHVPDSVTAAEASDAGQKSIEHLSGVLLGCSSREETLRSRLLNARASKDPSLVYRALRSLNSEGIRTYDLGKAASLFERFRRNDTWQVPTLVTTKVAFYDDDLMFRQTAFGQPPGRTQKKRPQQQSAKDDSESGGDDALSEIVRQMHRLGVPIMAGTDAPNLIARPGVSLHTELELLVSAGFTPFEALQTATIKPAEYLGLRNELGTIDVGMIADLVLLDADPTNDIRNTRSIAAVVLRGNLIGKPGLEELAHAHVVDLPESDMRSPALGLQRPKKPRGKAPRGPSTDQLIEAKQRLTELGYWTPSIEIPTAQTLRDPLIAFQKVEGLKRTGQLNAEDVAALRQATRPAPKESGPLHIEIDLARQVLFIVDGTTVSRILPVSTGNNKWFTSEDWTRRACTPCGNFKIYRRLRGWHKSPLGLLYYPNYILAGVAIHGSKSVPAYPASHGCIRIPMYAAKEFSELMPIGTPVIVYGGGCQP